MNPKLYTDEFRTFKFLKSSPEEVEYFHTARGAADLIQPWHLPNDSNFHWKTRLEFIEQLLDLREDTLYIVFAGLLSSRNEYETYSLMAIEKPIVLTGNPIIFEDYREVTIEDIPDITFLKPKYCIVESKYIKDEEFDHNGRVFSLNSLPIIPFSKSIFTEMFYDRTEAEQYSKNLENMLRHKINAVSSFMNRL